MCIDCTRLSTKKCALIGVAPKNRVVHYLHMPKKTLGDISSRPRRPTFLRAWRAHRALSQQAAGDLIGVSYTTVGRNERGANVGQAYLEAAAQVFGCEPGDFFNRPPWESPNDVAAAGGDPLIAEATAEVGRILKKSIVAARGQPQAPLPQEAPPLSTPKARPPDLKLLQRPSRLKRP
jgi:transcriptional regulator with XRE-family HTH domain